MFLQSEKSSNIRVRVAEVESYYIDSLPDGSLDRYLITFSRGEDLVAISWKYDSKDERDRVLGNVDTQMGNDINTGQRARKL